MKVRLLILALASSALALSLVAQAQGARAPSAAPKAAQTATSTPADYIMALVNSEPVTRSEVMAGVQRLARQLTQQRQRVAPDSELIPLVLERLINDKVQLQEARDTGIRVDQAAIDQAERNIAQQNQMQVAELRQRVLQDGLSLNQFRSQLQDQVAITRLRERDIQAKTHVSELEIDQYLSQQGGNADTAAQQINLAQMFIAVPEAASSAQVQELESRAQQALQRARAGADFATLLRELTADSSIHVSGGELGLRSLERYPTLFAQASEKLQVGEISALLRSDAGFHILKLLERKKSGLSDMTVRQSHARHILLHTGPQLSDVQAQARLADFRQRVLAGQADFAALARDHSQDASAAQGGDLGWTNPGTFVPEFETVLNTLDPSGISAPLQSRFGWHLVQLLERRSASLSPQQQREAVRNLLLEKKLDERYASWAQDLRGRAYVELREPPQ